MALPNLDLLLHNLIALCAAIAVLLLFSQLMVMVILRGSRLVLRLSVFEGVTIEDRDAFARRVRRGALVSVALIGVILLAAALYASFQGIRALDVGTAALERMRGTELAVFKMRLLVSAEVALAALVLDVVAKGLATALGKGISRSKWLASHEDAPTVLVTRLRAGLRALILCSAAVIIADRLDLPTGAQRVVLLVSYVLGAFYGSRLVANIAYLVVDVLFESSTTFDKEGSPLRYLGSLKHLAGITKRVVDYCVYLSAATWVADAFTPGSWLSEGGRIGVHIIAIFYASRVLVELCVLLIDDLFIGKGTDLDAQALQQRKTLLPVATGFVRYAIYFSALVMALREASIDPTPLLAGAGVVAVAIGFGAQTLVGDVVAGFFILFEKLLLVDDLVEIDGIQGRVEEIGVRLTKIRDEPGVLHSIPNGEVRKVANHSRAYVNAVIDVYVPYEEDLPRVRALLTSVTEGEIEKLTGAPGNAEVNVEELTEGSILLRVIARVPPGQSKDMGDVLRGRLVEELCSAKIGAPRPRRAVLIESKIRVGQPPPLEIEGSDPVQPFSPDEE